MITLTVLQCVAGRIVAIRTSGNINKYSLHYLRCKPVYYITSTDICLNQT